MNREKSIVLISNDVQKIYTSICDLKLQNIKEENIKELEVLKSKCKADNIQTSLLACHALVKLVEDGVIDAASTLSSFMTLLLSSK